MDSCLHFLCHFCEAVLLEYRFSKMSLLQKVVEAKGQQRQTTVLLPTYVVVDRITTSYA